MSSQKGVSLVAASMEDLRQGGVIYIRGQRAVITSLDFPLVFFRFDGEDRIRHRSFTASRDLFQVEDDIKPMSSVFSEPLSPTSQPGQHSRNNSSSEAALGAGAGSSPSDDKNSPLVRQQAEVIPHPEPEEAKRNLLNAFASRPTRVTIENKGNEQVVSEAATPRGVYINNCHGTTFDFVNKVASLTVHNCSNLKLSFSGTIQNAEFIHCRDSEIVSTESCPLWTLSNCQNVDLRFLGTSAATFLASGDNSVGNVLVAAPPPGDEFSRQEKELQFEPPAAAVVAEAIPENAQVARVNPAEWRTRWNVEGWHFGEIEKLERSGPQGYTINL